jgi:phosphoribosylglycinamide formyltransferase-1
MIAVLVSSPLPIAVLVSGSGTNLQALLDAAADPAFGAVVAVVISDRHRVKAIDRAEAAGIPAVVVDWSSFGDREDFTTAVCDVAETHRAEALVLAGFMRVMAPVALDRFPQRILNIHPSLLPSFPGRHAVDEALAHGVKVTGVTVHFVDEQVDHGPIIAQRAIEVLEGDTTDTLHSRIQAEEHRLYPDVVAALAQGRLKIEGRSVVWDAP